MNRLAPESRVAASVKPVRRHELDWLRVLAVFGLIPFHVAIIFTTGPGDYVKNGERSDVLGVLAAFVTFWGIPLIFLVAGASVWFALGTRSPTQYLGERIKRLLIPFIFGVLVIVPVQVYVGRLSNPQFHASYLEFYPGFLTAFRIDRVADYWAHLWFIPLLLGFSALTLPLFWHLRSATGRKRLSRLAAFCQRPGAIFLFGIPLGISETILRSKPVTTLIATYLTYGDWALFVFFLLFFVYGFVLYADPRFEDAILRHGIAAVVLGLISWAIAQQLVTRSSTTSDFSMEYVTAMFARGFTSWFWIVAIVSLGLRFFTFTNRLLAYLDEAFYPVYVLHMPVLSIIGYFVVRWPLGVPWKFLIILIATFIVTLSLYDFGIRRFNVMRYLFGMKPKPRRIHLAAT